MLQYGPELVALAYLARPLIYVHLLHRERSKLLESFSLEWDSMEMTRDVIIQEGAHY